MVSDGEGRWWRRRGSGETRWRMRVAAIDESFGDSKVNGEAEKCKGFEEVICIQDPKVFLLIISTF